MDVSTTSEPMASVILLLCGVAALNFAARSLAIPYPILMILTAACIGWMPGLPTIALDPHTTLLLFLPPLLFAAALQMPWRYFSSNFPSIAALSTLLVMLTTLSVAYICRLLLPDMPLGVAFALGALVAPPDAVAVIAMTNLLPLPRRLIAILEGESLLNDATSLILYRTALLAVVTDTSPSRARLRLSAARSYSE